MDDCEFTSISTVFQSYKDDGQVRTTVCNGNHSSQKSSPRQTGLEHGTARSVGNRLT